MSRSSAEGASRSESTTRPPGGTCAPSRRRPGAGPPCGGARSGRRRGRTSPSTNGSASAFPSWSRTLVMPASRSRAAPSSSSVAVRSMPTTSRTSGATVSAACAGAARHVEDEHVVVQRLEPGEGALGSAGERRIGTGEQSHLAVEGSPDHVVVTSRPVSWRSWQPLLQSDAMVVSASSARDRTVPAATLVAHARRRSRTRGLVARGCRRPRDAVAHPRAASTALHVRRRRRGRDRRFAPSPAAATGRVDPGRAARTRPRCAASVRVRCSSSRRWCPTAATACVCSRRFRRSGR